MSENSAKQAMQYYKEHRYQEAFDIWSKMTDDPVAFYNAAIVLYNGKITMEDGWEKAYDLFYDAALNGYRKAHFFCGDIVERELVDFDINVAALHYYYCPVEEKRAFERIKGLADRNVPKAQGTLAQCYYDGRFTERNIDEAVKWATTAYENGERYFAPFVLGQWAQDNGNDEKAIKMFMDAGLSGNDFAYNYLGLCYKLPSNGASPNYPEAIRWFKKGAEEGDQWSIFNLGHMYLCGLGCKQNRERAVQLFDSIINDKNPESLCLFNIGSLYFYGDGGTPDTQDIVGLDKDYDLAIELWEKASDKGVIKASAELAQLYYFGTNAPRDYRLAFKYANLADNNPKGAYILGCCYYFGHGCKKDPALAEECFKKALRLGYTAAGDFLLDGKALKPYSEWHVETNGAEVLGSLAAGIVSSLISGGDD